MLAMRRIRNCDIRGEHTESFEDDRSQFRSWTTRRILQCRGCEHVFVEIVYTNSEDYEQEYDVDGSTIATLNERSEYWPALSKRKIPEWVEKGIEVETPWPLTSSLQELYSVGSWCCRPSSVDAPTDPHAFQNTCRLRIDRGRCLRTAHTRMQCGDMPVSRHEPHRDPRPQRADREDLLGAGGPSPDR